MLAKLFTTLARWISPGPELKARALYEHEALGVGDPYYLSVERLKQIQDRHIELNREFVAAVKGHKARSHILAESQSLTTEQLQIERDLIKAGVIKPSFWQGA